MTDKKKPFYKKWWFIVLVVIFVVGGIDNATKDIGKETGPAKVEASKPAVILTPEDAFALIISDQFRNHDSKAAVISGPKATYSFQARENFTTNMAVGMMWQQIMATTQAVSESKELSGITRLDARATFPLVDEFGNESIETVLQVELSRIVFEKINWDNMTPDMFESLAERRGTVSKHAAIR